MYDGYGWWIKIRSKAASAVSEVILILQTDYFCSKIYEQEFQNLRASWRKLNLKKSMIDSRINSIGEVW